MDTEEFYKRHKVFHEKEWLKHHRLYPDGQNPSPTSHIGIALGMLEQIHKLDLLLDIGCGALSLLKSLKNKIPHLFGIDIINYSIWQNEPDIITKVVDINKEGIPFPDATFDCITMLATLEHLFDPFQTIREVYRALKPQGYFILQVPNVAGIRYRINLLMGRLPITSYKETFNEKEWDAGHIHYFTLKSLVWLLREQGPFRILVVRGSGRFQFLKSIRPSLFSQDLIILCRKT